LESSIVGKETYWWELWRCYEEQDRCQREILGNGNWNPHEAIYGMNDWFAEEAHIRYEFTKS